MKNENKTEVVHWILIGLFGLLVLFIFIPMDERQQADKQAAEEQEQTRLAAEESGREAAQKEVIKNVQDAIDGGRCYIRYSNWSMCTPEGKEFRIVNELEDGCEIQVTHRTCEYKYAPIFEMLAEEMASYVAADLLASKDGSFSYQSYDQATDGKYKNVAMIEISDGNRLTIRRIMTDSASGQMISDTRMWDAEGSYDPDMYMSMIDMQMHTYAQSEPHITEAHNIIWEQILTQYILYYADKV